MSLCEHSIDGQTLIFGECVHHNNWIVSTKKIVDDFISIIHLCYIWFIQNIKQPSPPYILLEFFIAKDVLGPHCSDHISNQIIMYHTVHHQIDIPFQVFTLFHSTIYHHLCPRFFSFFFFIFFNQTKSNWTKRQKSTLLSCARRTRALPRTKKVLIVAIVDDDRPFYLLFFFFGVLMFSFFFSF